MHIALLEDDSDQAIMLSEWLQAAGHKCDDFQSGRVFVQVIRKHTYDALLLDWMVPDMSGLEVLEWVRENIEWHIPVLFVTRMDREEEVVQVLTAGADDYMAKPVKHKELLARIEALGRRSLKTDVNRDVIDAAPYWINRQERVIRKNGDEIALTHLEFDLAVFLFQNYGRVLSRDYILEHVWNKPGDKTTRTVDTHISQVRKKLTLSAQTGWRLSSVYQHGYRMEKLTLKQ